jgi:sirohydrochlorin ferrochelatase
MRALVIVAHGSRRASSNDEVRALTDLIRPQAKTFDQVHCAFLELAEPSIPDGINAAIAAGAKEVVVLPYFLSAGRHVVEDIPGFVAETQQQNPDVQIRIAPYLGTATDLPQTLLNLTK